MQKEQYSSNPSLSKDSIAILLIEDNEDDAVFLRELLTEADLTKTFHLLHCRGLPDGLSQLDTTPVDLILLDLGLAECSGLETLHSILAATDEIPAVVLSGLADKSIAVEALRTGAQDYLVKGQIQSETLWRCIHYAIERHRLQGQIKQHAAEAQAAEERFRSLIEFNVDGMVIVNADKQIRLANPAAAYFFGKPADTLIGEYFDYSLSCCETDEITFNLPDKEVVAECLVASITWEGDKAHLVSIRDITDRKELEKELYRLANYDSLTRVYNRRVFFERLEHELAMTQRYDLPMSVLMIDIDMFKQMNDTHGHQSGDVVLKRVADLCQRSLRVTDTFGRIGGEEFGAIMPQTDLYRARTVGERLRRTIAKTKIYIDSTLLPITVTIGAAAAEKMHSPDQLMEKADRALYKGKALGRNRVVCAQASGFCEVISGNDT